MPNTILAVLDGATGAEPLIESLAHFSEATVVYTFSQAMEILQRQRVELIIAVVHLQDESGFVQSVFDFLRWVKGDPHFREIPFMCYSYPPESSVPKYAIDAARIAARLLGAARYECSTDSNDLKHQIEWLLETAHSVQQHIDRLNTPYGPHGSTGDAQH